MTSRPGRFTELLKYFRRATIEYLEYDSALTRWLVAVVGTTIAAVLWVLGRAAAAFAIASRVHRAGGAPTATKLIERALSRAHARGANGGDPSLDRYFAAHIENSVRDPWSAGIVNNAKGLLGYRVLVLKSPGANERGVIAIDYSYIFPLFAALYNIEQIVQRYYIVLEPSWRGLCTADILAYTRFDAPMFVQAIEPRDTAFLKNLCANFVSVPIAANWWVDHRVAKPDPAVSRDIDVVMVASWSLIKRHWRFFRVLAQLRRRGQPLRVALVGYPAGCSRGEIEDDARYFDVFDQIEFHEGLPLASVAALLARSKLHVLWSRKEGANRAIIEALFADVPIILREGLSYGYAYPYVNPATGRFANERNLGDVIVDVLKRRHEFEPRAWALEHMSCQRATAILEESIRQVARGAGQQWTGGLAVKTVHLETQQYWDPTDRERFAADYQFLEGCLRPRTSS